MSAVFIAVLALSCAVLALGAWAHWQYLTRASLIVWLCMVAMFLACGAMAFALIK
jgi:hypothetical protein